MSAAAQSGLFQFTDSSGTHNVNVLSDIAGSPAGQAVGLNPVTASSALPTVINPSVAGIFSNINAGFAAARVAPNGDPNLVAVSRIGSIRLR